MLQKSGYGIVIQVLSTSQCSAVLPSQYNPPFLPLQNPQQRSATTYLMNSKRWLFPCLFRVFMIRISVNTQGSVNGRSSSSAAPIAGANLLVTTRFVIDYYSNNMNISQSEAVRHKWWHRAETLHEQMRRHMPIPLLHAATCLPVFSSGSKNQNSFIFTHPPHPEFHQEIDDETLTSDTHQLAPGGPSHPLQPHLGHITPSFLIEKHFVLQPTLCAPLFHIPLAFIHYLIISNLCYPVVHTWTIEFQRVFSPMPR